MDFASIRGLFTPSVLFLLLNIVIGTIAVISSRRHRNSHRGDAGGGGHQLPIARSSSSNVMERVRALGLFRFRSGDLPPIHDDLDNSSAAVDPKNYDDNHQQQQFRRIQSESGPKEKNKGKEDSSNDKKTTKKSVSVKAEIVRRPPATVDEEVDAKADDFINKFRQQLKLQRLDSLLRYKEMLTKRN